MITAAEVAVVGTTPLPSAERPIWARGGCLVYRSSDKAAEMYRVVKGYVRLYVSTPDGREVAVGLVGPGETFGEERALGEAMYQTNAWKYRNTLIDTVCPTPLAVEEAKRHARERELRLRELWAAKNSLAALRILCARYEPYFFTSETVCEFANISREMATRQASDHPELRIYQNPAQKHARR